MAIFVTRAEKKVFRGLIGILVTSCLAAFVGVILDMTSGIFVHNVICAIFLLAAMEHFITTGFWIFTGKSILTIFSQIKHE